jgi:hypothetical protein
MLPPAPEPGTVVEGKSSVDTSPNVLAARSAVRARREKMPTAQEEIYDLTSLTDNRVVRNYEPLFLAKGGEHIVYKIPGRTGVVVKVDARVIRKQQEYAAEHGLPLDAAPAELLPHVEQKLAEDRARFARLREYFGRDHVPNVKQDYMKVPITPVMTYKLHGDRPIRGWRDAKEVWSIVKVQRRVPEVGQPGTFGLQFGYLEHHRDFLDGQPPEDFNPKELETSLTPLVTLTYMADKDPGCAEALREFARKTIDYARTTGEILDLAGDDNVVFFKEGEKWNYKLIDALYPGETDLLSKSEPLMRKAVAGENLDSYDRGRLMNIVNFVRGINGLAARLGLPDRLEVVPDDLKGKVDFFAAIER